MIASPAAIVFGKYVESLREKRDTINHTTMSSAGNLTPPDNDTSTPSMPAIDQAILLFHAIIFLLALVGNGLVSLSQRRHTHTVMPRHIVLSRHTVLQCRTVLFRHAILSCRTVMSCSLVILCSRVMSYSHVIQSCHTVMSHSHVISHSHVTQSCHTVMSCHAVL